MLHAQAAAEPASFSSDVAMMIALMVPVVVLILVGLFIGLLLRHLRFNREKLHDERLRMIDAGYPLEESAGAKRREKSMHNAFWISFWLVFAVPSSAFSAAAAATERGEYSIYLLAIWLGASAASIAAVICAAVLMISCRPRHDDEDVSDMSPKKPIA